MKNCNLITTASWVTVCSSSIKQGQAIEPAWFYGALEGQLWNAMAVI